MNCFAESEMSNFPTGNPRFALPDLERCRDADYSLFPTGWHSVAGKGLVYTPQGDFVGRAVQDCAHLELERVRVIQMERPDGARNVIRHESGQLANGSIGRATMSHDFDAPLAWREGLVLRVVIGFMPSSESIQPIRFNVELRGNLDYKPFGGALEIISVVVNERQRQILWGHLAQDGMGIHQRESVIEPMPLRKDRWQRLVIALVGGAEKNSWGFRVRFFEQGTERDALKWEYVAPLDRAIRGVKEIYNLFVGDEIQNDAVGGVVYYDTLRAHWREAE